jgi:pimeloyl-ACP methyl ester carboxylesterase
MINEALLLETTVGPIAAVLTLPDEAPVAGVFVLEGSVGSRTGANQLWVRLARSLSAEGIATLRADYAGVAESWGADLHETIAASRELGQWFTERLGGEGIVIVGHCLGLAHAAALCRDHDNVLGVALVVPPVYSSTAVSTTRSPRRLARKVVARIRYWRARRRYKQSEDIDPKVALVEIVQRVPTWILIGTGNIYFPGVSALVPELQRVGDLQVEVAEGVTVDPAKSPEAQALILEGVSTWVRRCVQSADARI